MVLGFFPRYTSCQEVFLMKQYTTILFDADGTLLDFEKAEEYSFFYTGKAFGFDFTPSMYETYQTINNALWKLLEEGGIQKSQLVHKRYADLFAQYHLEGDPDAFNAAYLDNLSLCAARISGALEVVKTLAKTHRLILVTNGVSRAQHLRMDAAKLSPYFDQVIVSEDAGAEKPSAQYFDYMAKTCGLSDLSQCLLVGDSLTADIRGAVSYGIDCCWFNPAGKPLTGEAKPTYEIHALEELYPLLGVEAPCRTRDCVPEFYGRNGRFNCAETMVLALCKARGIALPAQAVKLMGGFGGGMSCGKTCGALCGANAVLGLLSLADGQSGKELPQMKERTLQLVEGFEKAFGCCDCAQLKPRYAGCPDHCQELIQTTADLLEEILLADGLID